MSDIFDEASYVKYAENVIFDLQRCFRSKNGFENFPVIEMSAMLEELCFHQALTENSSNPSVDSLWLKKECIYQYQHQCEKMLRNLDAKERNWRKILEENEKNAKIVLSAIMKDDEAGRRKIESYRPKPVKLAAVRLPPAERLKNLTNGGNKSSGAKGKGGNKKGAIGKRKVGSAAAAASSSALLNASINWQSFGAATVPPAVTANPVSAPMMMPPDMLSNHGVDVEDDFNLDIFDDEGSHSIHLINAEAWQAPSQGQEEVRAQPIDVSDSSSVVWRSAIAEKESAVNRERELKQHRESQQDVLRRVRDEGMQSAAAKREEEDYASKIAEEREKREKLEATQLRDAMRERERKAREEAVMTVDLDNDRGLLDE